MVYSSEKQYIHHTDIIPQGDRTNAPLRIMAIDIEAIPKENGGLPTSDEDPIVLISLAFDPPWRGQENVVMVAKNIKCTRKDVIPSEGKMTCFASWDSSWMSMIQP